jgi:hypothetical protein
VLVRGDMPPLRLLLVAAHIAVDQVASSSRTQLAVRTASAMARLTWA